jgi:hypothetical protein
VDVVEDGSNSSATIRKRERCYEDGGLKTDTLRMETTGLSETFVLDINLRVIISQKLVVFV